MEYSEYVIPEPTPMTNPSMLKSPEPPMIPAVNTHPANAKASAVIFCAVSLSWNINTEKIRTKHGAVYRRTAVMDRDTN